MEKYIDNLIIKIPTKMKEEIKEKAASKYKNVSEYIRDLIVEDLQKE